MILIVLYSFVVYERRFRKTNGNREKHIYMYIYGMKEYKVAKERFVFNRSIIISSRFVEFKNGSREVVRKRTRRESNCKY